MRVVRVTFPRVESIARECQVIACGIVLVPVAVVVQVCGSACAPVACYHNVVIPVNYVAPEIVRLVRLVP